MEKPFSAYVGEEPYVFVCYAHADASVVYQEISWLNDQGINIWYDEGISPGENWRATIGKALIEASRVVVYLSSSSLKSDHCNREINLALDEGMTIVPVYLEPVELTHDLKIGLNRVQALRVDKAAQHRVPLLNVLGRPQSIKSERAPSSQHKPRTGTWATVGAFLVLIAVGAWFIFFRGEEYQTRGPAYNLFDRSFDAMDIDHQVELLEKSLQLDPGFLYARARLANSLVIWGLLGADQPQTVYRRARDEALTVLAAEPDHSLATLALARTYLAIDRNARMALATLDDINLAATTPSQYGTGGHEPLVALIKANIFLNTGQYELAERTMASAYERYPESGGIAVFHALTLYMVGKVEAANSMFDEALRLDPGGWLYPILIAAAESDVDRVRGLIQVIRADALHPLFGEPLARAIEGEHESMQEVLAFYEANREQQGTSAYWFTEGYWWANDYEKHLLWYEVRERENRNLSMVKLNIALKPDYWEKLEAWSLVDPGAVEYRSALLNAHRNRIAHITAGMVM